MEEKDLQKAAVLVLCCQEKGEEQVVLTKRTEEVLHHKGQICFPGGVFDPGDQTLWQTALREAKEEVGVNPYQVTFVKELQSRPTPTGFLVTPFVGEISQPPVWNLNLREIAEIFTVPLSYLRDSRNLGWVKRQWNGCEYLDPVFTYRHHEIWGLTGRILCEFLGHPFPDQKD